MTIGLAHDDSTAAVHAQRETMLAEVLAGLRAAPRMFPNKYLWDERGSALFERICLEPDYHPAHQEGPLLSLASSQIADRVGMGCTIVDFGCGSSRKVEALLDTLPDVRRYVGIDISAIFMEAALGELRSRWPHLEVLAVAADYSRPLPPLPIDHANPVLGFFPGSSICNMPPRETGKLLTRLHDAIAPAWLLLGCEPPASEAHLEAVYNSPAMHAFHENILIRLAEVCGADMEAGAFRHQASVGGKPVRVEAKLVAQRPTMLILGGETFRFERGESIVTDWSYKYTAEEFKALAEASGWHLAEMWQDSQDRFNLYLLRS